VWALLLWNCEWKENFKMYSLNVVNKFLILIFEENYDIRKILTGYSYSPIWGGGEQNAASAHKNCLLKTKLDAINTIKSYQHIEKAV